MTLNESTAATKVMPRLLVVTTIEGLDAIVADLEKRLGAAIEIAAGRPAALRMLDRKSYSAVVLDQMLAESDPEGADLLWNRAALALPLQISFATVSSARLERELRAALARREREQELAREVAISELEIEMKNAVTTFLLESHLALREAGISSEVQTHLQTIADLASHMKSRLQLSVQPSPNCGIEAGNSPK